MNRNDIVVLYGPTTTVLADRFREHLAPLLPTAAREAWWKRTDYGWACSVCPNVACVKWSTLEAARKDAVAHAHEHGGAKVEHVPDRNAGDRR